jgi:hypothetical protein
MTGTRGPLLASLLAVAIVLTGCSSGGKPQGAGHGAQPAGRAITTAGLTSLFAGAGIGTYADAAATTPSKPVTGAGRDRLLQWQVETMARQLRAERGYRGTDLDALVGGQVPISVVLAAYVKAGDTAGAKAARALMGDQDFDHRATELVYPDAVVALFVNDVAGPTTAALSPATTSPAAFASSRGAHAVPALAPMAGGICTQLQDFLSGTLDSIVQALQIDAQEGIGGVLASIWNTVISIAASAAKLVVQTLTAPVLKAIRAAATVLAVLSSASSLLDPWTVSTTADPDPVHFGIGSAGNAMTVTSKVASAIDFTWPEDVKDCATAAGVTLPDPGSAKDSPVTWKVQADPGVATVGDQDATVGADGAARLHLTTGTETQDDHDHGDLVASPVSVSTDLERTQIQQLLELVKAVLLDALPGPVQGIVAELLGPLQSATQQKLQELLSVAGPVTWLTVNHHVPGATPSPATPSASDCPAVGTGVIPDGTWAGPITLDVQGSAQNVQTQSSGSGELQVIVEHGQVTGGTWALTWHSTGHGSTNGASAKVNLDAQISGKVVGTATKPVVQGSWTITGKATVTSPVKATVPIDESGHDSEVMTGETTACDTVTGTFVPSFNAHNPMATFSGTARWVGHPTS